LSDLIFMVREAEVDAARVHVDRASLHKAQHFSAHGAALDVPARPTRAPGARPRWISRAAALPQHEVIRVALVAGPNATGGWKRTFALCQCSRIPHVLWDQLTVDVRLQTTEGRDRQVG
jgi:hypothetical protein